MFFQRSAINQYVIKVNYHKLMRTSIQLLHPQPLLLYILDQLLELVHQATKAERQVQDDFKYAKYSSKTYGFSNIQASTTPPTSTSTIPYDEEMTTLDTTKNIAYMHICQVISSANYSIIYFCYPEQKILQTLLCFI